MEGVLRSEFQCKVVGSIKEGIGGVQSGNSSSHGDAMKE